MAVLSFADLATAINARTAGYDTDYADTVHASNFSDKEIRILDVLMLKASASAELVDLSLTGDLTVGDDLTVTDDAAVGGSLAVTGDVEVTGALAAPTITGAVTMDSDVTVDGEFSTVDGFIRPHGNSYSTDTAITITPSIAWITKGSQAALTLAAPSSQDQVRITIISTTAFGHVVTVASGVWDGTATVNTTLTFANIAGASITLVAKGVLWYVESLNAVVPAP